MNFYKIKSKEYQTLFKHLDVESQGAKIMSQKANIHTIYIKDLHVGAANILKQDALSIGADLAVPVGTILAKEKYVDAVLIGSTKHLKLLSKKELAQPFGLKDIAKALPRFILKENKPVKIMGVINANEDSFFEKSRFMGQSALEKIQTMIDDGADIIDIGAVSTRPGSVGVSVEEELSRIKPICDLIQEKKLFKRVKFSIDSYTPEVIEYALKSGFEIVNDITGLQNNKVCEIASRYKATVVIMHMQGTPQTMQDDPHYDDVMIEVDQFFTKRIEKAKSFGIEKLILDVGIGFGKSLQHNLTLLQNLEHFKHFGFEVLIGASRKSLIDKITPTPTEQRLPGTLAIHLKSIDNGATIVRCHDVQEHTQAIKVFQSI